MKDGPVAQILKRVQERTGKPVHVEPDTSLPPNVLAKLDVARGNSPVHRIAIHPSAIDDPDYLIVFQAGFLLRRFAVPSENRTDFAERPEGETTVRRWVEPNPQAGNVAEAMNPRLIRFLCSGLLSQLRSMPVGLRVDDWIRSAYPELAALQRKMQSHAGALPRNLAVDGKTIRDRLGLVVTLVDTKSGAPVAVMADVRGKGHELKLTQRLPASDAVNLRGAVITADSLHCQDRSAHCITREKGGDHILQVRANQPTLEEHARNQLAGAIRGHWGCETRHWERDKIWNEDRCLMRSPNAACALALLRVAARALLVGVGKRSVTLAIELARESADPAISWLRERDLSE